uniref:Uncharacterized protein n=1 Tax=Arundo donax TaxID=35708 RepID=A0A0A9BZM3_ARUDO
MEGNPSGFRHDEVPRKGTPADPDGT